MVLLSIAQKRMCELKSDTDACEMFIGIFAAGLIRIDDRECVRIAALRIGDVVIRDDEIDAVVFCPRDGFETADTAVDTYHHRAAGGFRFFKRRYIDAVA